MWRSNVIALLTLTTLAAPAAATVLCKKKSGVVVARETCKKREAALDLNAIGLAGPKGDPGTPGAPGVPGSARAYAHVNPHPSAPTFDMPRTKGFADVAKCQFASAGCYCLTPSSEVDASAASPVVSVSDRTEQLANEVEVVKILFDVGVECPAGSFKVVTLRFDGSSNAFSVDDLGFAIAVP